MSSSPEVSRCSKAPEKLSNRRGLTSALVATENPWQGLLPNKPLAGEVLLWKATAWGRNASQKTFVGPDPDLRQ